jgi:NDP-sugar pyrophosphorylase family protein
MKIEEVRVILTEPIVIPLKYPWDIFPIKDYLLENISEKRAKNSQISPTATLKGKVILEEGAKIFDYATIEGPVYIGKNAVVGAYCTLRDHSILEEGAEIQRYADCARSIIETNSHLHSGFVGDSIIGESVRIGAGFVAANRRIDRKEIEVKIENEKVNSGRSYLGVLIGNAVRTGINVSTMPGVLIGSGSLIGPNTVVKENVESKSLVYTEYKQLIKNKRIV